MNTRRDLTPPNFLAVLERRNKLGTSECYNCGEQVERQGYCDNCDEPWHGDGGNGFIPSRINFLADRRDELDRRERACSVAGVGDARVSTQPSDRDATSALPYSFPVDSEIYDH